MPLLARVPPGRAGRLWLRRRTATAQRGREQLDRKLRVLVPELLRRREQLERSNRAWALACAEAETWLLRASVVSGQDGLRHAMPGAPTRVELLWATAVGVTFPTDVVLVEPEPHPRAPVANAAVAPATEAYRAALRAGAQAACDERAVRLVEHEVAVTRRRLRALEKRWLPWLEEALRTLELTLEQSEQEDTMRRRRAVGAPTDRARP